jgi:septal ring factor EnvC (AmiA/AmiB activator)
MHLFRFRPPFLSAGTCRAARRASFAVLLVLGHAGTLHAQSTDPARQKTQAESERTVLREKLQQLKRTIGRTEAARSSAVDSLAKTEAAISEAKRSLVELAQEQQKTRERLNQLAAQQAELEKTIGKQQKQLAKLVRRHYIDGGEDRVKLLLSGDNPNRINRGLQYLSYLSQAQAALVGSLQTNLQAVETRRAQALNAKAELDEIAQEEREQEALLAKEKRRHAALVARLSDKLEKQRREAGAMERDETRLTGLVFQLQKLIEEQEREEAIARRKREAQQREIAAKQLAEREKRRAQQMAEAARAEKPGQVRSPNPDAIDDDEPPAQAASRATDQPATAANDVANEESGVFAALRGRLMFPVQGELAARFGSPRSEGPAWKGLFIRAAEGSDVRSVAAGRVIFADWLRGFGNLIIIDHGGQYMTIYGNNQAVLKRAGDRVGSGEVIASAGSSGGNEQSGLYFEMRHQGRAFDPLGWITVR